MWRLNVSLAEKFWDRVPRLLLTEDECWLWRGSLLTTGYGKLNTKLAHRLSWEIHNGPIPRGLLVCHTCDNPPCVNPKHLFLGTVKDNALDASRKGRTMQGTKSPQAILTDTSVRAIRARAGRESFKDLAKEFGVSYQNIYAIVREPKRRWPHVV